MAVSNFQSSEYKAFNTNFVQSKASILAILRKHLNEEDVRGKSKKVNKLMYKWFGLVYTSMIHLEYTSPHKGNKTLEDIKTEYNWNTFSTLFNKKGIDIDSKLNALIT